MSTSKFGSQKKFIISIFFITVVCATSSYFLHNWYVKKEKAKAATAIAT